MSVRPLDACQIATLPPEVRTFVSTEEFPLFHYAWTRQNEAQPVETCLDSPLLALHKSSAVNELTSDQVADAREVLRLRRQLSATARQFAHSQAAAPLLIETASREALQIRALQRRIVERFIEGRRAYFGRQQCAPFGNIAALANEGRDLFIVVKFMDEATHLRATLASLLLQEGIDLGRVVIVAVNNNSRDGSDAIVREVVEANRTRVRIIAINQPTPGGGSAARFGVDRSIATVYEMCRHDDNWDRLQTTSIAVSDGDNVFHPRLLAECAGMLAQDPNVDGVMPFLTYKFTAANRLFKNCLPALPRTLSCFTDPALATPVPVVLGAIAANERFPRWMRKRIDSETMEVILENHAIIHVPLCHIDDAGRRFGVLRGSDGHLAYLLADCSIVLDAAPPSGTDDAMLFLANGCVRRDEKWRWHALIGHDLFLGWAFAGMAIPTEMVYPDTSDAGKMFRVWSFAIGGQHQLSRPDLPIVTGTDYQSGRVLQAVGCTIRLGPPDACAETEIDRLTKMFRNFAHSQSVFYGETRSSYLERASGLYLHMTRIQGAIEATVASYPDEFFRDVGFPERIVFPLRWLLQNAIRFYAHFEPDAKHRIQRHVLQTLFGEKAAAIERHWLHEDNVRTIRDVEFSKKQEFAEKLAEGIISEYYPSLMAFYKNTLRSFFHAKHLPSDCYTWLLDGIESSRNALLESRPRVHPSIVWQEPVFVIDEQRGQVIALDNNRK